MLIVCDFCVEVPAMGPVSAAGAALAVHRSEKNRGSRLDSHSLDLRGASYYDRANLNIRKAGENLEALEQVRSVGP